MLAHIFVDYLFYRSVRLTLFYHCKAIDFVAVTIKHLSQRPLFTRNGGAYRFIVRAFPVPFFDTSFFDK